MKQEKIYRYMGNNGIINTPIEIPNVPCMIKYRLIADNNKILTNGSYFTNVIDVFEDELDQWYEIDKDGQE